MVISLSSAEYAQRKVKKVTIIIRLNVNLAISRGPFFGGSDLVFCLYSFISWAEFLLYVFGPARHYFDALNQSRNFRNLSETITVQSHKWAFLQLFSDN